MSVVVKACPTCGGSGEVQHPAQAHRNIAPWNEITVPCPDPACDNGQVVDNGMDDQTPRTTRHPAPVDVHVLLTDLYQHDQRGYGRWSAGLRHRVEDALGWHDHQWDRS